MKSCEFSPVNIVRAFVACKPTAIDEPAIRLALGDAAAKSLAEVAVAFNVSYATVKHTWRPNGMPGDSKRRHYPWADILVWWIARNIAAEVARAASSVLDSAERRELATIQLATARADLRMRETKLQRLRAEWVPLPIVQSVFRGILSTTRDRIMGIACDVAPMVPVRYSKLVTTEVERVCRLTLEGLATSDPAEIARRAYQETKGSNGYADDYPSSV